MVGPLYFKDNRFEDLVKEIEDSRNCTVQVRPHRVDGCGKVISIYNDRGEVLVNIYSNNNDFWNLFKSFTE